MLLFCYDLCVVLVLWQVADVPKETEFQGISNLVEAASRYSDMKGKTLFACLPSFQEGWRQWGALDDVVRGEGSTHILLLVFAHCTCVRFGPTVLFSSVGTLFLSFWRTWLDWTLFA